MKLFSFSATKHDDSGYVATREPHTILHLPKCEHLSIFGAQACDGKLKQDGVRMFGSIEGVTKNIITQKNKAIQAIQAIHHFQPSEVATLEVKAQPAKESKESKAPPPAPVGCPALAPPSGTERGLLKQMLRRNEVFKMRFLMRRDGFHHYDLKNLRSDRL